MRRKIAKRKQIELLEKTREALKSNDSQNIISTLSSVIYKQYGEYPNFLHKFIPLFTFENAEKSSKEKHVSMPKKGNCWWDNNASNFAFINWIIEEMTSRKISCSINEQIDILSKAKEYINNDKIINVDKALSRGIYNVKKLRVCDPSTLIPLHTFKNAQSTCRKYHLKLPVPRTDEWWPKDCKKSKIAYINWMINQLV